MLRRTILGWPLLAQEPTFTTSVKIVDILASVRTKSGQIVKDLTKEDFVLLENGRPQELRYFSREGELPLTVGLLIDTSMSQEKVLNAERSALRRFLDQVLREKLDQVFVMQFDMAVQLRQKLTSSRKALDEVLNYVDTPSRNELRLQTGGGTLLYEAVYRAVTGVLKDAKNRKALIVLSDGEDFGSEKGLEETVEAAVKSDVLVYTIFFTGGGGSGEGHRVMRRLAQGTGAGYFEVNKRMGIEQIFDAIQEELRGQYDLGFVSDQPARLSEFRKLQLLTKQKGLVVQARERYLARP
ncbi:MAG: VWA domain-containing protein [Bryobacteraceae bacterium]|nr:VWA domain-containing protein [Bryobacteraceae bacterium]